MDPAFLVWLILLLPLAGAVLNGIVPLFIPGLRQKEGLIGSLGTAMVVIPFVLALYLFVTFAGEPVIVTMFTWMAAGDLNVSFAYRVDELSLIMTLIVTGVGGVIHLYSNGYMHGDPSFWRFFSYLNLFIFMMLNLVLGNNLPVLFLGWEGVGLCSYLLIGFWYENLNNSAAANKAFIMNRIGDFAFLLAMFILFRELGSLDFDVILTQGPAMSQTSINWVVFLLFFASTGKSAQIPLYTWLPDAMAGPTPVSALIHAATMVTSGLYLLARLSVIVLSAPVIMALIAIMGALTALVAATIAITQNDIKKVLAYSTVSQLGYMFLSSGVGAFSVAIFHVMTHAFFKGCLFLGSGSVIHSMEHVEHELHESGEGRIDPQDMRTMGGLKKYMPSTRITFMLATLAIAGIPLFAGFFSKDEILARAFAQGYDGAFYASFAWIIGVITALLTAIYMTRCYVLTFEGTERWPAAETVHPHESPWTMTTALWILGVLSVVGGFIGLPAVIGEGHLNWIHHFLAGEEGPVREAGEGHVPLGLEWGLIALSSLIALAGVGVAWQWFSQHGVAFDARIRARFGKLYDWAAALYHVDDFYNKTFVSAVVDGAEKGLAPFDQRVVDGLVNGLARATRGISQLLRYIQTGEVQSYAVGIVFGMVLVVVLMLFA